MSENLFCPGQKTASSEYRRNWDLIFSEMKDCRTCKHWRTPILEEPCEFCFGFSDSDDLAFTNWEEDNHHEV